MTCIAVGVIALIAGVRFWYNANLDPVSINSDEQVRFIVESGSGVGEIAADLEAQGLIRSATAFTWYVRGEEANVSLQAGTYVLSPSMSVPVIVSLIAEGKIDASLVTLLPGRRLDETRQELIDEGWSEAEVDAALEASYDHALLADKPRRATLEGYIFPDTYEVNDATNLTDLLIRTFDNLEQKMTDRNLFNLLKARGLDLHEAFTLASIVEEESGTEEDKPKVAQVFLTRLDRNLPLGADATFYYAAAVTGEELSVSIDSPYNTRINTGLPPGPISNFTITSLVAVADPADTDYLYFVSGDDGITRFSKTLEEHQRLTKKYCIELCKLP